MTAELLETIETIRAEEASMRRLFDGDVPARGRDDPAHQRHLTEAGRLVSDVLDGRRPTYLLREAMGTSSFPLLFGEILDRQLFARYEETRATYRSYARVSTVPDFRLVSRHAVDGAEGVLDAVPELAPYPEQSVSESRDQYQVAKHGRRIGISWEAIVSDDLDAFRDLPDRLARAARRSEQRFATGLFVDATGPHASLYDGTNTVPGNPVLSVAGLQAAMTVFGEQVDEDNEPIAVGPMTLVVPPALEVPALNLLNALSFDVSEAAAGGTSGQVVRAANWMQGRMTLEVEPYIPVVANSANGQTSWFLFASPGESRPAVEIGFLRGYQEPGLFVKSTSSTRPGGGTVAPTEGDFDTDSHQLKVRHVFGGTRLTATGGRRATVASNGTGSS